MARVAYLVLYLIVLVQAFSSVFGLTCSCNRNDCGDPPRTCTETVLDACGCCMVCAKGEGERCGGPWDVYGVCASDLNCFTNGTQHGQNGTAGVFATGQKPAGTCLTSQEVMLLTSPCLVELKGYQDSLVHRKLGSSDSTCIRKPTCTPEGWYTSLQCDGCAGECWCSDKDGQEVANSRAQGRNVVCN